MGAPTAADTRTRTDAPSGNGRLGAVPLHRAWNVPWILLGVVLVAGSALAFAVLGADAGGGTSVLALATDVAAGEVVREGVLTTVDVDVAGGVAVVAADRLDEFVDRVAVVDLPAGTLVTGALFTDTSLLGTGEALVGIRLDPSTIPIAGLRSGDPVMVVGTSGAGDVGDAAGGRPPDVWTATVVAVAPVTAPAGDFTLVTVRSDAADAPAIAAASAADRVRLVLVRSLDDVPPELLFADLLPAGDSEAGAETP